MPRALKRIPMFDNRKPYIEWLPDDKRVDDKKVITMEKTLVERLKTNPADTVAAHDLGLFHYWRAKNQTDPQTAVRHWHQVIACWAVVLENDGYWDQWTAERSSVYEKKIKPGHIDDARDQVSHHIVAQLSGQSSTPHLAAAFFVEINALRILRRMNDTTLAYGPLMASRFAIPGQTAELFRRIGLKPDTRTSVDTILAPIKKDAGHTDLKPVDKNRRLTYYFSQLCIPYIYIEKNTPARAVEALAEITCPDCGPLADETGKINSCRARCPHFETLNPSYAHDPALRKTFQLHAAEMSITARLQAAHRLIAEDPVPVERVLTFVRQSIDIAKTLDLQESFLKEIVEIMFSWSDFLLKKEAIDAAAIVLQTAGEWEDGRRWQGKLALVLNARGVRYANNRQWQDALPDLRRAHQLNPSIKQYRENLENVLHACAAQAEKEGDTETAQELLSEAADLGSIPSPTGEISPESNEKPQPEPKETDREKENKEKKEPQPVIFKEKERFHPALFNSRGFLETRVFNESGLAILQLALENAQIAKSPLLTVPLLTGALVRYAGGETERLLRLQGTDVRLISRAALVPEARFSGSKSLAPGVPLTQFNIWFATLDALALAFEIAAYDRGDIGEPHILYGLLACPLSAAWLANAGADISYMLRHAVYTVRREYNE